jgi:hypothetical protein
MGGIDGLTGVHGSTPCWAKNAYGVSVENRRAVMVVLTNDPNLPALACAYALRDLR